MSSNCRITALNAVDHIACVLSSTVAPTTLFPLSHLQNQKRGRFTRIPSAVAFSIKGTYGGMGVRVNMVSGIRVTIQPAGTYQFIGYSDENWTNEVYNSGAIIAIPSDTLGEVDFGVTALGSGLFDPFFGQKMFTHYFVDPVTGADMDPILILSWKLIITDTGNTDGWIDMSRRFIGAYHELYYNPQYGAKLTWQINSKKRRMRGGSLGYNRGIPFRELSLDFKFMPDADAAMLTMISRYLGDCGDMHLSFFPKDADGAKTRDYAMQCVFSKLPSIETAAWQQSNTSATFEEI